MMLQSWLYNSDFQPWVANLKGPWTTFEGAASMGVRRRDQNGHLPSLKIDTKNKKFLEDL